MDNKTTKPSTIHGMTSTGPLSVKGNQPSNITTTPGTTLFSNKKTSWRRIAPCLAFLAAFSTAMALLLVWSEAVALRRQAFDVIMTKDYVLSNVPMDNPDLVSYIGQVELKHTEHQVPLNVTQTPEENYINTLLQGKHNGVYVEYINRINGVSTTTWLESNLNWRGIIILTDFKSFFETCKSSRNPKTRVVRACLSTDKVTKEITYHHEPEVKVTKLEESPNSLTLPEEGLPYTRLLCFPLYSILLAYNTTSLDYLSLDSPDGQDSQVLDTIPWDLIRISVLSVRSSPHLSEAEITNLVQKLNSRSYKLVNTTDTGKRIFVYNRQFKI